MSKCEHDTVEQVRGKMGLGDYFDVIAHGQDEPVLARPPENYHEYVEINENNRTDVRIICKKCYMSTGWMRAQVPGMPEDIGIPAIRQKWAEMSQYTIEEYNAIVRQNAKKCTLAKIGG
jgi:hypothetical protein